jgi:hypothetical protein
MLHSGISCTEAQIFHGLRRKGPVQSPLRPGQSYLRAAPLHAACHSAAAIARLVLALLALCFGPSWRSASGPLLNHRRGLSSTARNRPAAPQLPPLQSVGISQEQNVSPALQTQVPPVAVSYVLVYAFLCTHAKTQAWPRAEKNNDTRIYASNDMSYIACHSPPPPLPRPRSAAGNRPEPPATSAARCVSSMGRVGRPVSSCQGSKRGREGDTPERGVGYPNTGRRARQRPRCGPPRPGTARAAGPSSPPTCSSSPARWPPGRS